MALKFYLIINYLILFLWAIKTFKNIFFNVYLWQLKEYRLDRFSDYLKTVEARRLYLSRNILIKIVLVGCSILTVISNPIYLVFPLVILTVFTVDLYKHFGEIKKRGFLRPKITLKSGLILLLAVII